MRKVLLFGNGYCLNINELVKENNKPSHFMIPELNKEGNFMFDFTNSDLYDFLHFVVPLAFEGVTKEQFEEMLVETNLEEIFSEMYFENFQPLVEENSDKLQYLSEITFLFDQNDAYVIDDEYYENDWNKREDNLKCLIGILNDLLAYWISTCYTKLSSNSFSLIEKIMGGYSGLPQIINEFTKFDKYWTTNFERDDVILRDIPESNILYLNGKLQNDSFEGVIFDGLIQERKTKENLINQNAYGDERRAYILKHLNIVKNYRRVNTIQGNNISWGSNAPTIEFELSMFGISPIHDEILFKEIASSNPSKIYFYYYQDDYESPLNKFNLKIKKALDEIFGTYYFIPSEIFRANPNEIDNLDQYLIEDKKHETN